VKKKLLLLGLILSFSLCYTEWGTDQSAFIWKLQLEILSEIPDGPLVLFHSLLLSGWIGQLARFGLLNFRILTQKMDSDSFHFPARSGIDLLFSHGNFQAFHPNYGFHSPFLAFGFALV